MNYTEMNSRRQSWCTNVYCEGGIETITKLSIPPEPCTEYRELRPDAVIHHRTVRVPCNQCYPSAHKLAMSMLRYAELNLNCSILEPCYHADCPDCNPPGSIPSNMRFARHAISELFRAKRELFAGRAPFPKDPAAPTGPHNLKRYNKW